MASGAMFNVASPTPLTATSIDARVFVEEAPRPSPQSCAEAACAVQMRNAAGPRTTTSIQISLNLLHWPAGKGPSGERWKVAPQSCKRLLELSSNVILGSSGTGIVESARWVPGPGAVSTALSSVSCGPDRNSETGLFFGAAP